MKRVIHLDSVLTLTGTVGVLMRHLINIIGKRKYVKLLGMAATFVVNVNKPL